MNNSVFYGLNKSFNFDNFIVGDGNKLAIDAARSATENIQFHDNPLFIHGDIGTGKSHLLHAIGNVFNTRHPELEVGLCGGERFRFYLINCLRNQTLEKFRELFSGIDVLLFDDFGCMLSKTASQEELYFIINRLLSLNKLVVIASSVFPHEGSGWDKCWRSMLESGHVVKTHYLNSDIAGK